MREIINLDFTSPEIIHLCAKDKRLAKVINIIGPISYEKKYLGDAYAFLIHEIIEQMLSVKAGNAIYGRFVELCGGEITPVIVAEKTFEEIKSIGTSNTKAQYIMNLTQAVINKELLLEQLYDLPDDQVMKKLTAIKGIGTWTAKMFLIFVLDRKNVLPYEDVAFLQSYQWLYKAKERDAPSVKRKCKKWEPYASVAARYLYRALDMGLTRKEFHLYK